MRETYAMNFPCDIVHSQGLAEILKASLIDEATNLLVFMYHRVLHSISQRTSFRREMMLMLRALTDVPPRIYSPTTAKEALQARIFIVLPEIEKSRHRPSYVRGESCYLTSRPPFLSVLDLSSLCVKMSATLQPATHTSIARNSQFL